MIDYSSRNNCKSTFCSEIIVHPSCSWHLCCPILYRNECSLSRNCSRMQLLMSNNNFSSSDSAWTSPVLSDLHWTLSNIHQQLCIRAILNPLKYNLWCVGKEDSNSSAFLWLASNTSHLKNDRQNAPLQCWLGRWIPTILANLKMEPPLKATICIASHDQWGLEIRPWSWSFKEPTGHMISACSLTMSHRAL